MAYRLRAVNKVTKKPLGSQMVRLTSYFQPSEPEYNKEPVYPPILDMSLQAVQLRKIEAGARKITSLPTVEEKLIELNAPKYYGWWACQLHDKVLPYNTLPFAQFATRTHLARGLPAIYDSLDDTVAKILPKVRDHLSELVLQEFAYVTPRKNRYEELRTPGTEENRLTRNLLPLVNRLLISHVLPENKHLATAEIDLHPRVEAFWSLGGIEPDRLRRKSRENNKVMQNKNVEEPIDRPMQYRGTPCIAVRHKDPLPQLIDRDSGLSVDGAVPKWHLDPRTVGLKYKHTHGTNIPGFWPGAESQHGYLSILSRGSLKARDMLLNNLDHQEGLDSYAVLHSFAWTLAQACYLGFGPFTELTYPIASQTIITNGQHFSFYAYQLNTCALYHKHSSDENPHRNVCFGTEEMKLFDVVENGQIKGLNEDVIKNLIKFYLVRPVEPTYEMRPFLSPERYIANTEDLAKRQEVERQFKHLLSNRPRHLLKDEIYHWEKIYKIDHDTRPMEAKRRFFEVGSPSPDQRRMDDHAPRYIPRNLRNPPKKSRRGRLPVQPTIKL